ALDPVDGIDLRIARIAKDRYPVLHAPAPGIVARERQDVVAAIVLQQAGELGSADLQVVRRVGPQALEVVLAAEALARISSGLPCIRPIACACDQSDGSNALSWRMMANSVALSTSTPGPSGE